MHKRVAVDLQWYQRVVFDIDGTLLIDDHPLPGAIALVEQVRALGARVCFGTNASFVRSADLLLRLRGAGLDARDGEALTAIEVLADLVQGRVGSLAVPAVAPRRVLHLLGDLGVCVVDPLEVDVADAPVSDIVVAGFSDEVADDVVVRGAALIGASTTVHVANLDAGMVTARGVRPGSKAIVHRLEHHTGCCVQTAVAGKPSVGFARAIDAIAPCRGRTLLVGDSLASDVGLASAAGWDSLLVLTGIYRVDRSDGTIGVGPLVPTAVARDLTFARRRWDS